MAKEHELTYDRFLNMLSQKFGYADEVKRGFSGIADLAESGAILDADGKPIEVDREKGEEGLKKLIQSKLASGEPLYIYRPGEQYPNEVTYDPAKGLTAGEEPVTEPKKPEKEPNLFSKSFFFFFRATGIMSKTYRDWYEYGKKKEAFAKLSSRDQLENRRRNDRELRKSGDALLRNDREELTEGLLGLVEDQLGYGAEMKQKGPEALLELMDQNLVYNEKGEPIKVSVKSKSPKQDLMNTLGRRLEAGEHIYIYQKDTKGKSQPREIYYDRNRGKLMVTDLKELEAAAPKEKEAKKSEEAKPSVQPLDSKERIDSLAEKLEKANGGQPLSQQARENVENICRSAQLGVETLKRQMESDRLLRGGDSLRYILLQNSLETQAESGKLDPTFMQALEEEHGLESLRRSADLCPAVKQMTGRLVNAEALRPFLEGGEKLNSYTKKYLDVVAQLAAKFEAGDGPSIEEPQKDMAPTVPKKPGIWSSVR